MRLLPAILAFLLLLPTLATAAPAWTIEEGESRLAFQTTQAGGTIEGAFARFGGDILFDPNDLGTSAVNIVIDISSITTGSAERDGELPKPDWFDTAAFPTATFAADTFRSLGGNGYAADGTLTIRDITLPVTLPFTLDMQDDGSAVVKGEIDLDRTDLGVGQGDWAASDMIGRKVTVSVQIKARRQS
ncbi:YceI family protein [Shinella sp.]|uniref:YceI family protein n=1 Tax=Shinella sp. TaxID=1870904 RepID=UPI003F6F3C85